MLQGGGSRCSTVGLVEPRPLIAHRWKCVCVCVVCVCGVCVCVLRVGQAGWADGVADNLRLQTTMRRLTTGMRSEICVVRRLRRRVLYTNLDSTV